MFQEALDLFRKYVSTQERIAQSLEKLTVIPAQQIQVPVEQEQETANDLRDVPREDLKAELDNAGAEYNKKASTKTLANKVLELRQQKEQEDPASQDYAAVQEASAEEGKEEEKTYTLEEVREALMNYAKSFEDFAHGKDQARKLLQETGNVDRLGELDESKYPEIMTAIKGES